MGCEISNIMDGLEITIVPCMCCCYHQRQCHEMAVANPTPNTQLLPQHIKTNMFLRYLVFQAWRWGSCGRGRFCVCGRLQIWGVRAWRLRSCGPGPLAQLWGGGGPNLCLGKLLAVVLGPPGLVGASMQEGCGYTADATCE
jgi:hypothetical protein